MKKDEFLQYLNDIGLTTEFLDIYISDKPSFPICLLGACKKHNRYILFSNEERNGITIYDSTNEDLCFDKMKTLLPGIMSQHDIVGVYKNHAYQLTENEIADILQNKYDYNQNDALALCRKIKKYTHLYFELKLYLKTNKFLPDTYAVTIDNNNTKTLSEKNNISVIKAFETMADILTDKLKNP